MVVHSGIMEDGPVPIFASHFILCEVGAGHLGESVPGAFKETVEVLSFDRGCNNLIFFVVYLSEALYPDDFSIEVGVEPAGKSAYVRV